MYFNFYLKLTLRTNPSPQCENDRFSSPTTQFRCGVGGAFRLLGDLTLNVLSWLFNPNYSMFCFPLYTHTSTCAKERGKGGGGEKSVYVKISNKCT